MRPVRAVAVVTLLLASTVAVGAASATAASPPQAIAVNSPAGTVGSPAGGTGGGVVPAADRAALVAGENATIDHEGDELELAAAESQVVTGTTSLDACAAVTVQLRSAGGESPFVKRATTRVGPDGRFVAVFDLSDVDPGQSFYAEVRGGAERLSERVPGRVVDGVPDDPPGERWNLEFVDSSVTAVPGEAVTVPVRVDSFERAGLVVGESRADYHLTATVVDGDGDGRVDVVFDTATAGTDAPTVSAAATADEVTVDAETELDDRLAAGDYPLQLFCGDERADEGTLTVDGGTGDSTPVVGPADGADGGGDPEFANTIVVGRRGEVVPLEVALGNASAATVTLGGDRVNYEVVATVRDGSGDGRVVLLFDTSAPDPDEPVLRPREAADEVTIDVRDVPEGHAPEAGDYPLALSRGAGTDDEVDIATLILEEAPAVTPTADPTPTAMPDPTATESTHDPSTPTGTDDGLAASADPVTVAFAALAVIGFAVAGVGVLRH